MTQKRCVLCKNVRRSLADQDDMITLKGKHMHRRCTQNSAPDARRVVRYRGSGFMPGPAFHGLQVHGVAAVWLYRQMLSRPW